MPRALLHATTSFCAAVIVLSTLQKRLAGVGHLKTVRKNAFHWEGGIFRDVRDKVSNRKRSFCVWEVSVVDLELDNRFVWQVQHFVWPGLIASWQVQQICLRFAQHQTLYWKSVTSTKFFTVTFRGGMLQKNVLTSSTYICGRSLAKKLCFRSFNFHFGKSLANNFVFTSSTFHGEDVSQQLQLSVSVGGIPTWMITWVGEERDGYIERQRERQVARQLMLHRQ